MSGFDRLGRELERSAERGPTSSRWRRAGNAGGVAAIAAALATVAVIAVGAVALLHGRAARSTSAPGSSSYTQAAPGAQVAAWTRLLKCPTARRANKLTLPQALFGAPKLSNAAPDPRLVARLAVLRGPWTAADEAPAAKCQGFDGFLGQTIDIRYVRYVGPGLEGGQVFLVPGTVRQPPLPPLPRPARLRFGSLSPDVCLITVGGRGPSNPRCTPLTLIEHPFPVVIGTFPLPAAPMPLAQALGVCDAIPSKHPAERARCIARTRHSRFTRPLPIVDTGVVRDGIASVDVYAGAGHPSRRILPDIRVKNNVYAFVPTGYPVGLLSRLGFRDTQGRPIPTTPFPVVTGRIVSTAGRANIPLLGARGVGVPTASATVTGTIAPAPTPRPSPPPSSASPRTGARHRR